MANIQEKTFGAQTMLFDPEHISEPSPNIFTGAYWQGQNKIIGAAKGRGTTYFFQHNEQEYVLRHYLRGGLIGKLLDDQYLYTGLTQTRAWQEFNLLRLMLDKGLPCPKPIAANIQKSGLYYRGDIILEKIPQAQDAYTILLKANMSKEVWRAIGATIQHFHQHQIYHHDLNIHNIMLDNNNKPWLIDFDKCAEKLGNSWKKKNLERLYRSLCKEKSRKNIHWQEDEWQALMSGYNDKI